MCLRTGFCHYRACVLKWAHTHTSRLPLLGHLPRVGIMDMQTMLVHRSLHLWIMYGGFLYVSVHGIAQDILPVQCPAAFASPSVEMIMHGLLHS